MADWDEGKVDDFIDRRAGAQADTDLRQSMIDNIGVNPDVAARVLPQAMKQNLPLAAAVKKSSVLEQEAAFEAVDYTSIIKKSPMLADFLRDRDNMALAHDDIGALTQVADFTRSLAGGAVYSVGSTFSGFGRMAERHPETGILATGAVGAAFPETVSGSFKNIGRGVRFAGDTIKDVGEFINPPEDRQGFEDYLAQGLGQVGVQIAAAVFTGGASTVPLMVGQGLDMGYDAAERNGITDERADQTALLYGGITALTEKFGLDALMKGVPAPVKREVVRRLGNLASKMGLKIGTAAESAIVKGTDVAFRAGSEATQETTEGFLQNLADKYVLGEKKSATDGLGLQAGVGGGVGAIVGLIANAMVKGKASFDMEREKTTAEEMKTARGVMQGSKLFGRARERFNGYLRNLTNEQDLFVGSQPMATFYQGLTDQAKADLEKAVPGFAEQVREAQETGADVTVKTADYFTYIQPLDEAAVLDNYARYNADESSVGEREDELRFMQEIEAAAAEDEASRPGGEQTQNNFYRQLIQRIGQKGAPSGNVDVARLLAENPRKFYETVLARTGNDPRAQAILDRLVKNVSVRRNVPNVGQLRDRVGGDDLFIEKMRLQARKNAIKANAKKTPAADMLGYRKKRKETKARSTPLVDYLIFAGQIKSGSMAAQSLAGYDITPKSLPRLFSPNGKITSLDTIIAGEVMDAMSGGSNASNLFLSGEGTWSGDNSRGTEGYVPEQVIVDTVADEIAGKGLKAMDDHLNQAESEQIEEILFLIGQQGVDVESASNAEVKAAMKQMEAEWGESQTAQGQELMETLAVPAKVQEQVAALEEELAAPEPFEPETKPEPIEPATTEEKIEDFGEKIGGAKKDLWGMFREALSEKLPSDPSQITLSKYFPVPDYETLIAQGVDTRVLGAITAMRNEIPTKPQKGWKLKDWSAKVQIFREFANDMIDGKLTYDALLEKLKGFNQLTGLSDAIMLYTLLGYPAFTKAKGWDIGRASYSMYAGVRYSPAKTMYSVSNGKSFGSAFETFDEALAHLKAKLEIEPTDQKRTTKLDIYQVTKTGEIVIGKKVGTGKFIDLKGGFTSAKEARLYLKDNEEALLTLLAKRKDTPPERRSTNDPRRGKDYRMGENVTQERFSNEFGFRGVQFGNYVEQKRRVADLNNAYDALLDLANLLGVPSQALSLNGSLGLAFGARGSGGKGAPAAHYESAQVVINLTKNAGPGTLAHEWFHALDNFFGKKYGDGYLTNNPRVKKVATADNKIVDSDAIRPETVEAFKAVMDAIKKTEMRKRSKVLDKTRSKDYWSTDIEMAARAFEAYIIARAANQGEVNDYLANIMGQRAYDGVLADDNESTYPYPTAKEMADTIAPAFDKLFDTLDTRQGEKGTEFFQSDQDGARGSINFMPDGEAVINLFEKENLSTVLHELGHLYWKAMTEIAALPDASEQIREDVAAMREWVGAKGDDVLTVEQEEKIADGFLAYLRSGDAPSADLKTAFLRFKGWLIRLYRGARDTLPKITPEVKGVFDRMLATDEEIERLKADPIFDIDQAIMNLLPKAQAERMRKKYEKMVAEAKERLLHKSLKEFEQRRTKEYKEARASIRAAVESSVNSEKAYRLVNAILQAGGLKKSQVVKIMGKEVIPYLSGHGGIIAKSGGADPNVVAGIAGYGVREMFDVLMNLEQRKARIERLTDEELNRRYGDMLNDGTLEREAIEAYHNELRAEIMGMEMKILADLGDLPAPSKDAIKVRALEIMDGRKVSQIIPYRHLRAENKAYFDYGKALGQKQFAKAARAKGQQLLNHYLYRMSLEARAKVDKRLQQWRRLVTRADEKLGKTIDADYVYAARAILAKYGIGRGDFNFAAWAQNLTNEDPDLAEALAFAISTNTEDAVAYKDMTWGDFQGLADAIDNLIETGKGRRQITVDGKKMAIEDAVAELNALLAGKKGTGLPTGRAGRVSEKDQNKKGRYGLKALWRRTESYVQAMDGGNNGPFRRLIWNRVSEAVNSYRAERAVYLRKMLDILAPHKERLHEGGKIVAAELVSQDTGEVYVFEDKGELIGMLLHLGNGFEPGSNGYKLLAGYGWSYEGLTAFLERAALQGVITDEDWDLVQAMWDLANEMKPKVWRAHKEMYGFRPKEVSSVPFYAPVNVQAGNAATTTTRELKGGYWPAIADRTKSDDAAERADRDAISKQDGFTAFPTTGRGATMERNKTYAAPLEMSLRLLPSHIDWALRFAFVEPAVKDVGKLMLNKQFRAAIGRVDPTAVSEMLMPWLQRAARQTLDTPKAGYGWKAINRTATWLRREAGLSTMAGHILNALQQLTGLAPIAYKTGKRNFARAFVQYMGDMDGMAQFIADKSTAMRYRQTIIDENYLERINRILEKRNVRRKVRDMQDDYGYIAQHTMQKMVDNIGWIAAFNQALAGEAKGIDADNEVEAVRYADSVIRQTQGSMNPEDASGVESQTALGRLFTLFYSFFSSQGNLLATEAKNIVASDVGVRGKAASMFYLYLMCYFIPSVIADLIVKLGMGDLPDDDDEDGSSLDEWFKFFAISQAKYASAMVPWVGQATNAMIGQFTEATFDDQITLSPAVGFATTLIDLPFALYDAMFDEGDWSRATKDLMIGLGVLFGPAFYAARRPVQYAVDVAEGDSRAPEDADDLVRGLISGRGEKQ